MIETLKKLFYLYQRSFWYVSQAKGELLKPLGFWNETLLILTFLAVSGEKPNLMVVVAAYIVALVIMAVVGKIIVISGIVRYNTHIGNKQNSEIQEIIEMLKRIEDKIK